MRQWNFEKEKPGIFQTWRFPVLYTSLMFALGLMWWRCM